MVDVVFTVVAPDFKASSINSSGMFGTYASYELALRRLSGAIHNLCKAENLELISENGMVHPNVFEYIVKNTDGSQYPTHLEIETVPLNVDCISHFAKPVIKDMADD